MPDNTTPEDRHPARLNALKHGLRSESFVLPGVESIEEWESFRDDLLESLQPVGHLEAEMAQRVAHLAWRLRRALRAEHDAAGSTDANSQEELLRAVARINNHFRQIMAPEDEPPPEDIEVPITISGNQPTLPGQIALNKIMRYEAQYTRQLFQTLHALQALQEARHGRKVPLIRVQWH